jgi:hypothetical protein
MPLSSPYWPGVIVGAGLGLLVAAALVEQGLLAPDHKAWAGTLGIGLVIAGNLLGRRGRWRAAVEAPARDGPG